VCVCVCVCVCARLQSCLATALRRPKSTGCVNPRLPNRPGACQRLPLPLFCPPSVSSSLYFPLCPSPSLSLCLCPGVCPFSPLGIRQSFLSCKIRQALILPPILVFSIDPPTPPHTHIHTNPQCWAAGATCGGAACSLARRGTCRRQRRDGGYGRGHGRRTVRAQSIGWHG
jgi:hypothetical protein